MCSIALGSFARGENLYYKTGEEFVFAAAETPITLEGLDHLILKPKQLDADLDSGPRDRGVDRLLPLACGG
jgi:hypothetical protein